MQGRLTKNSDWLDIVETLSVLGAIGGSIVSVVSQQLVFASIPLSLSVTLNMVNRRRLLDSINQSHQTAVTSFVQQAETQAKLGTLTEQLVQVQQVTTDLSQSQVNSNLAIASFVQENVATQAKLGTLTEQLAQLAQLTNDLSQGQNTSTLAIASFVQENAETQAELETLTNQLKQLQQLTNDLGQGTNNLQHYTQSLREEQTAIAYKVGCLREIDTCTQSIRIKPNSAQAYYNRGLAYQRLQRLEDKEAAISDFTQAIRINPKYAEAYHSRGLIHAELGNKKGAVEDLREAAKLFFEEGDIANYQTARELSKKFHDLNSQPKTDAPQEVAVGCLFS